MKKKTPARQDPSNRGPIHICYERIIPDSLDPERDVRHALRDHMVARIGKPLDADQMAHVAKMAVITSKKWSQGATVKCLFLDGPASVKKRVEKVAHKWEHYCNIKLQFVTSGSADIRISFVADPGSWSAVGRDALNRSYFPLHQPTMNFGWLTEETDDTEYNRVVLHEFGHALACIHEHQSPTFDRVWNVPAVMKYFQGPPNNWSPADIRSNVLEKYSPKGIKATVFDPKSIMLYDFDARLFSDGLGPTNENEKLSRTDIRMIGTMYPKS